MSDHVERMKDMQKEMRAKVAAARTRKGLILVHTGDGKGKSTAAVGMLVRALGHGFTCAVVQFIKGERPTAETALQKAFPEQLTWDRCGDGFTWDTQNREADMARAREGWEIAKARLQDPACRFLLLDELNVVLHYKYLPLDEVLADLGAKHTDLHVVLTGRGAPPELIALADLVTEMKEIKHPFKQGVRAQAGIEF